MIISIKPFECDGRIHKVVSRKISDDSSDIQALMDKLSRPESWRLGNARAAQMHLSFNRYTPIWHFNF